MIGIEIKFIKLLIPDLLSGGGCSVALLHDATDLGDVAEQRGNTVAIGEQLFDRHHRISSGSHCSISCRKVTRELGRHWAAKEYPDGLLNQGRVVAGAVWDHVCDHSHLPQELDVAGEWAVSLRTELKGATATPP